MTRAWLAAALVMFSATASAQDRLLDDFSDPALWKLSATDDVQATLRSTDGLHGKALCIDYDFGRVTGYVTAQRALPLELPPRYAFAMNLRGAPLAATEAPRNAFQFKLVDASGENVWWGQRPEFRFPAEWQPLQFRQRQIEFAWGPTSDRTLRRSASVEFVIASGSGTAAGPNRGSACFDGLTLRRLPDVPPAVPAPVMRGDALGVDFGIAREFGALALRWRAGAIASSYAIELSDDGVQWRRVRTVERARGAVQTHWLPDAEARFVRVVPMGGATAALEQVAPLDPASANAFFAQLAQQAPRGAYPRAYVGEQSYWTVLGVDGGRVASLLSEDGALEPLPGVGALEPFLVIDGRVRSWADARITHSLVGGDLPMPAVHWQLANGLTLDIEAFGHGTPEAAQALARYTVRNRSRRAHDVALALAWRPFQANPPTQFLANPGGASEVKATAWNGRELQVDGKVRVVPLTAPDAVRTESLAAGPVGDWLAERVGEARPQQIVDDAGFASGVLRYRLHLRPGERREIAVALPVSGVPAPTTRLNFKREQQRTAALWRERLDRVQFEGPAEVADIARTMRSALGQILVNRSGAALQPGARAYARSWIRDGALTSSALLRLGHEREAREFILWFARFQFKNGKVPCCATVRGADPVPENDSDGEFAFAVADLRNYTHDATTARALWPNVRAAIEHMETLRQSERSDKNTTPDRSAYFGLMPPSISHEGYSDKPAYSYWDDFWAATGYRSGFELAQALGLPDDATRIAAQRAEFEADLLRSLTAATQKHGLSVLPGAADRGDVDPTSSTVALSPGGLLGRLPDALVRNTFDRWWRDFETRRADDAAGRRHGDGAYTPYEWRNVGALLRLGERERALQAMAYFYRDRRPAGWNQWAEVVVRDAREPRFLGDMPHGWVASDQIRSVLDLFGYEHEGEHALVLAAGVPMRWLAGRGLRIAGLRTPYGALSWRAHTSAGGRQAIFEMAPLRDAPPGGVWLRGPWPASAVVRVDGRRMTPEAQGVRLPSGGGRVVIDW
jgi:F5/8 type C domain